MSNECEEDRHLQASARRTTSINMTISGSAMWLSGSVLMAIDPDVPQSILALTHIILGGCLIIAGSRKNKEGR